MTAGINACSTLVLNAANACSDHALNCSKCLLRPRAELQQMLCSSTLVLNCSKCFAPSMPAPDHAEKVGFECTTCLLVEGGRCHVSVVVAEL
jgi:hypothetical protein